MIPYETLLDAARQHFVRIAASADYTRPTRNAAAELARQAADELNAFNAGYPARALVPGHACNEAACPIHGTSPAWDAEPEPLRPAA